MLNKKKIVLSILTALVFCIVSGSQIMNVVALPSYSDTDSVSYTAYGSSSTCSIWVRVTIWAGPKAGGGVYMNHQRFEATIDVDDAYGLWYEITYKVQYDTYYYEFTEPANKIWNPGTWYDNTTNAYEYKTSHIVVYAYIKVVCRWESAGHVEYQHSAEAEASYECYL